MMLAAAGKASKQALWAACGEDEKNVYRMRPVVVVAKMQWVYLRCEWYLGARALALARIACGGGRGFYSLQC